MWRGTRSRVLARTGEPAHAEELARGGVELAGETDFLLLHADALTDLADVHAVLGRPDAAAGAYAEAIAPLRAQGRARRRARRRRPARRAAAGCAP